MKLSGFIVSMLVLGMFATVLATFYAGIGEAYPVTYDNASKAEITTFNKFAEINKTSKAINEQLFTDGQEGGGFDLVGKFLGAGFNTLKLAFSSLDVFYDLTNDALTDVPILGQSTDVFKNILVGIVSIIVMFIIISALVGRDL